MSSSTNVSTIAAVGLPIVGLVTALGGTYASYKPSTDQNLVIGSLVLIVVHIYANFGIGGFGLRRTLGGDKFTLAGYDVAGVATVSNIVLVLILALQVAYIERNRVLPASWRKRKGSSGDDA